MKKSLIFAFVLFVSAFLLSISNVSAAHAVTSRKSVLSNVEKGSALPLCVYYDSKNTDYRVEVYYSLKESSPNSILPPQWHLYYQLGSGFLEGWAWLADLGGNSISVGNASTVFINNDRVHHNAIGRRFSDPESSFVCPKYAFVDTDFWNELCFADVPTCGSDFGTTFSHGPYELQEENTTIFGAIKQYASTDVYKDANFKKAVKDSARKGTNVTKNLIPEYTKQFLKTKYSLGTTYLMPGWIEKYVNNIFSYVDADDTLYEETMNEIEKEIKEELKEQVSSSEITQEEADEIIEKVEAAASLSYEENFGVKVSIVPKPSNCEYCNGLLGTDITKIVTNIFTTVQFAGPILVVVLTMMDFVKAVSAGSQDEIKKSSQKFMKRAAAAVLLFFVPIICNFLFSIAGITVPEMCIDNPYYKDCNE